MKQPHFSDVPVMNTPSGRRDGSTRQRATGLTMVELLVAMLITTFVSLGIFNVLSTSEGRRRVTAGINNIEQAGGIAAFILDQWIRNAGSNFSGKPDLFYGCNLYATNTASGQLLPRTSALPAPFNGVDPDGSGNYILAPVLIFPNATTPSISGNTSDVLLVMASGSPFGGPPLPVTAKPTATTISVNNTLAIRTNELAVLADPQIANTCLLTQVGVVANFAATSLQLTGQYYSAAIDGVNITDFTPDMLIAPFGVATEATSAPQLYVIGVGDDNTLMTYDLLNIGGPDLALQARATGIFEIHALYGVDTNGDDLQDAWVAPTDDYAPANMVAGRPNLLARLRSIKSIRIAIVTQSSEIGSSRDGAVSPASLVLFPDLEPQGLSITRDLSAKQQRSRYRVIDTVVVLRNTVR